MRSTTRADPGAAQSSRPSEHHRSPKLLLAEDDGDLRSMIATELRAVGYHVVEARTGAELLNEIAAALLSNDRAAQPDVIVCDIVLPGVTGLEILAGLRDAKWGTVIILMTGHSDRGWREEATALGADAFFQKPFEVDDLVTAVLNIVPASRRPGAHRKPRDAAS